MKTRILLALSAYFLLFNVTLMALEESAIAAVMKSKIDDVTAMLQRKDLDKSARNSDIFALFDPVFDYALMARLSLGKEQWLSLDAKQKEAFTDKFVTKLKESYVEKLDLYTDEQVVIKETKKLNKSRIQLMTELTGKESSYDITYKFYDTHKEGWKIYDVDILGVSLVQTYRSQFAGVLKEESFASLLQKIDNSTVDTPQKK